VQTQATNREMEMLEGIWESRRESVRRFLIALGRDIDLADDLLQETYLRARAGIPSHRDGASRAWLTAIAGNVLHSHARQRRVRPEVPLHNLPPVSADTCIERGELLAMRHPIARLPTGGRTSMVTSGFYPTTHRRGAKQLQDRRFRLCWKQGSSSVIDCAYIQVVRLPAGAQLLSSDPEPDETRGNGATTLIWRRVLPAATSFECTVDYALDD
jgi:DNA-directed RNA polymerase specialized sigma24 family protein